MSKLPVVVLEGVDFIRMVLLWLNFCKNRVKKPQSNSSKTLRSESIGTSPSANARKESLLPTHALSKK